jgi:hypothetical protein
MAGWLLDWLELMETSRLPGKDVIGAKDSIAFRQILRFTRIGESALRSTATLHSQQMGFGHSFDTTEKQGHLPRMIVCLPEQVRRHDVAAISA